MSNDGVTGFIVDSIDASADAEERLGQLDRRVVRRVTLDAGRGYELRRLPGVKGPAMVDLVS